MANKLYTPEELKERKKARQKAYYERNKERIKDKNNTNQKKRYKKDPIKTKANYEKNKDKVNARRKELYRKKREGISRKVGGPKPSTPEELKERKRQRAKEWYHKNKERNKEKSILWKAANPDKVSRYSKKYYIKKKGTKETDFEKLQTIVAEGTYYTKPKKPVKAFKPTQEVEYKYYTDKAK